MKAGGERLRNRKNKDTFNLTIGLYCNWPLYLLLIYCVQYTHHLVHLHVVLPLHTEDFKLNI